MSTDLQFRAPPIPRPFQPAAGILRSNHPPVNSGSGIGCERDSPTTPTSVEHKIPVLTSPPPAPLNPRRLANPKCKRKLDFFDAAHNKEVEDFFTSRFAEIQSRRLLKRKCPCT